MLAWLDHYATATKALVDPFAAVAIRTHAINLVRAKKAAELFDRLLRTKRWPYFANGIEHTTHALLVGNRQRKAIARTTARINEGAIEIAPVIGPLANTRVNAGLNAFRSDKAFDVGAEFGAIFCSRPHRVLLILLVDERL